MAPRKTYLDWNATAPVHPEVVEAMSAALAACGNPSSVHAYGRQARQALEAARREVASLVNAGPTEVVFTSGGTEANHLALNGCPSRRRIVSAIERDSVRSAAPDAAVYPVLPSGIADLAALERMLASDRTPALVSLMLANNETGAIQPVAEAARLAHAYGALLHCDAVQAAGRLPIDAAALGVDLLSLSAHKIGGPMGVGALIARSPIEARQRGGGQESGRRAGTENLPGIIGFGVAARLAMATIDAQSALAALRDEAERRLIAVAPEAVVFAAAVPRLANTCCIAMPGVPAATQLMALDLAGVMVSAGAACSSGKVRRSPVLEAMGVAPVLADTAIRISLGWRTSDQDVAHLVEAWGTLYARTRATAA